MIDIIHRYFVKNKARIISVRKPLKHGVGFIRCRCGNSDGFYWGRWQVTWRIPYSSAWGFDGAKWVPAYSLKDQPQ